MRLTLLLLLLTFLCYRADAQYTIQPVSCYSPGTYYMSNEYDGKFVIFEVSYPEASVWSVTMELTTDGGVVALQNDVDLVISPFTPETYINYTVYSQGWKRWIVVYMDPDRTQNIVASFNCYLYEAQDLPLDPTRDIMGREIQTNYSMYDSILAR